MNVQKQISDYIASQPEPKQSDMKALHTIIQEIMPECELWFMDGKNSENKVVTNPNIGYGRQTLKYADGKMKEFYRIGISANTTGISIYILSIPDRTYLIKTYGKSIGKASVTGYCIKMKSLKGIEMDVLKAALKDGFDSAN